MSLPAQQLEILSQRIEQEIKTLQGDLRGMQDAAATVELDQTRQGRLSRMDALQGQAMAQAAQRRSEAALKALFAARSRLNSEDYGYCKDCDELIAWPRLKFNPVVQLCIGCAEARDS